MVVQYFSTYYVAFFFIERYMNVVVPKVNAVIAASATFSNRLVGHSKKTMQKVVWYLVINLQTILIIL